VVVELSKTEPQQPDSLIGRTLDGRYEVLGRLGEGGVGVVYKGRQAKLGRFVAIKVLHPDAAASPEWRQRFEREARALSVLAHPNVVSVTDSGIDRGVPFLVMELLQGKTLADLIKEGPLPLWRALDIARQLLRGLAFAHGKGIVHRDLKPDNLYLVPDDSAAGGIRVKVLDFGIAKLRDDLSGGMAKTQAGSFMGTPPYMSPEQCRGITDSVDHRTDVYAMGIILFEMLCGAPPFVSEGWGEVVLAHLTRPPPAPRSINPAIPEAIEVVILKALAKEPNERFATAADMRGALRALTAVSTFPPRATSGAMPALGAPVKQPTTLRTTTGEMLNPTLGGTPETLRAKNKRRIAIVAAGAVAVAAVVAVIAGRGKGPDDAVVAKPIAPAAAAPAIAPAPPPAPSALPPAPSAPPRQSAPPPSQILVHAGSEPAGGSISDTKRGAGVDSDNPARLEHQKDRGSSTAHSRAKKHASAAGAPAASTVSPSPQPAAPTTPPPVMPPPSAPAKSKAEKW
jgi:serine/threonine-protein kinase